MPDHGVTIDRGPLPPPHGNQRRWWRHGPGRRRVRSPHHREGRRRCDRARIGRPLWRLVLLLAPIGAMDTARVAAAADASSGASVPLTHAHLASANDAIVEELLRRRHARRHWEPATWNERTHGSPTQRGGYTALVAAALVRAGVSYQDPRLAPSIEWLAGQSPAGTYAVAMRTMLWAMLPPRFMSHLETETARLLDGFDLDTRSWGYESPMRIARRDNSLRQFGALALREAVERGARIDPRFWMTLEESLLDGQLADGGWPYLDHERTARGSMTAAGAATLLMIRDTVRRDAVLRASRHRPDRSAAAIDRAVAWLEARFDPSAHPGHGGHFAYWAYAVERLGLAGGLRSLGGVPWFPALAAELLARCGAFDAPSIRFRVRTGARAPSTTDLAFTLLFLARGREPIVLGRLDIPGMNTALRPAAAAGMAQALGAMTESVHAWQSVHLLDGPEALLESAVLMLASDQAIPFVRDRRRALQAAAARAAPADEPPPPLPGDRELDILRAFLHRGGLLLALAESGSTGFSESVEALGDMLLPGRAWRTLPREHPAASLRRSTGSLPLRAIGNGVRECIILVPRGDLTASWQGTGTIPPEHRAVIENVYLLASEMDRPQPRLSRSTSARQAVPAPEPVIRVVLAGVNGAPPEPHAAVMLAAAAAARGVPAEVRVEPIDALPRAEPPAGVDRAVMPDLLWLSGVDGAPGDASLDARIASVLADSDAIVLIETAGGLGDFARGLESGLERAARLRPMVLRRHPVVTGEGLPDGRDLDRAPRRPFAVQHPGGTGEGVRLRGLARDGRLRVIICEDDLSHALLDRPMWAVSGPAHDGAVDTLLNVLRWIRHGGARPAP